MGNYKLEPVTEERDLGILVTDYLKPSKQCHLAYSKAKLNWQNHFLQK